MTQILPLATAMIFNVVLPNASLAYSSIQFYQVVRVLLTPCVVLLNYMISRATIPMRAALTLIPVCIGVAVVSYFDTVPQAGKEHKGTSFLGVFFAFAGVFASSIYTVWIATYHKLLECTSMQLLLNQAPISVLIMLYIIPFSDDITIWNATPLQIWLLILCVSVDSNIVILILTIDRVAYLRASSTFRNSSSSMKPVPSVARSLDTSRRAR